MDPVDHELAMARERGLRAALANLAEDRSPAAEIFRQQFTARLADERANSELGNSSRATSGELHREALKAARQAILDMRSKDDRRRRVSSDRRGIRLD